MQQLDIRKPALQRSRVVSVLSEHNVEPWFLYAYDQWRCRWHIWRGIHWVIKNIRRDGKVLETGCGCGWNLFWLAANGFTSLDGIDIDVAAVTAGNELAHMANYQLRLRSGNALLPGESDDGPYHLILALNWTYHVTEFDMEQFLNNYGKCLVTGGVLLIDTVDSSFDSHLKSRFLTSDWNKPEDERRPSEYLHRCSNAEVRDIAKFCGYRIVAHFSRSGIIPRSIYALAYG